MSGLNFLRSNDFHRAQDSRDGHLQLRHTIPGFSLILFYSTDCEWCDILIPIFKKLPGTVGHCKFGMINVNHNRGCVDMSSGTSTPIEYVPYILLYVDGVPYVAYDGPHDAQEISRFIVAMSERLQKGRQFVNKNQSRERGRDKSDGQWKVRQDGKGMMVCTTGQPLYGHKRKRVCYLNFSGAYGKDQQGKGGKGGRQSRQQLPSESGFQFER